MMESSKLLNGDACRRTLNGKNASKNGYLKNHCPSQQSQKYRHSGEKVKAQPARSGDGKGLETTSFAFCCTLIQINIGEV